MNSFFLHNTDIPPKTVNISCLCLFSRSLMRSALESPSPPRLGGSLLWRNSLRVTCEDEGAARWMEAAAEGMGTAAVDSKVSRPNQRRVQ